MADSGGRGYVAVVGAVNVDISGESETKLIYGDSNPGRVSVSLGGVGRNIAENLLRLGFKVKLITAVGGDGNAKHVVDGCGEIGLDISQSLVVPRARTSTYLCVNDCDGEIAAAVNDMAIYREMTPKFLKSKLEVLNGAELTVLDANIPLESVEFIAENCSSPIAADPVSVKKAGKLKHALGRFAFIKPNRPEASLLTGVEIRSHGDLPRAAEAFFQAGLKRAIISLGAEGCYYNDGKRSGILPCNRSEIVNTTGCGDAFLAGAAAGLMQRLSLREMTAMGLACAGACAASQSAVNPEMSMNMIKSIINGPWKEQSQ